MSDNTHLDLKGIFLSLLQDPEIAETLQGICNKSADRPSSMQDAKETEDHKQLRSEFKEAQKQNSKLKTDLKTANDEIQRLSELNKVLQKQANSFKSFRFLTETYGDFCKLPEDVRSGYGNLICTSDPLTFVISGAQTENLELIWDRVCCYLTKYDENTLSVLKSTLDLFFSYQKQTFHRLERLNTVDGDAFNEKIHDKTSDSPQRGLIAEVILEGYKVQNSKKIIRSIVRLK